MSPAPKRTQSSDAEIGALEKKVKLVSAFIKDVGFPIFAAIAFGVITFIWSGWVRADRKEERTSYSQSMKELKESVDKNTSALIELKRFLESVK